MVPQHIQCPPYAQTAKVPPSPTVVEIKTAEQIQAMRKACRVARKVLNSARDAVKVTITLKYILLWFLWLLRR